MKKPTTQKKKIAGTSAVHKHTYDYVKSLEKKVRERENEIEHLKHNAIELVRLVNDLRAQLRNVR